MYIWLTPLHLLHQVQHALKRRDVLDRKRERERRKKVTRVGKRKEKVVMEEKTKRKKERKQGKW